MENIILITGANSGIGKAAAVEMAILGWTVVIACRNKTRGEQAVLDISKASANNKVELLVMDLSIKASIQSALQKFKSNHKHLDVLIHNAAEFDISRKKIEYSTEDVETVWAANFVGPAFLTELLTDSLAKSPKARIITVSSKGLLAKPFLKINFDDPEYRNFVFSMERNYYQSKLALMTWTVWKSQQLKDKHITVNCVRVPTVKVDLSRYGNIPPFLSKIYALKTKNALTPEQMAQTYVYLATSQDAADVTGQYFSEKNSQVEFPKKCLDTNNIKRLADITLQYLK